MSLSRAIDKKAIYARNWREKNKERIRVYNAEYEIKHKEERLAYHRAYRETHRVGRYEENREWVKNNRDRSRDIVAKALFKMRANRRIEVIKMFGGKCVLCGYDKDFRALQIDHVNGGGLADRKLYSGQDGFYKHVLAVNGKGYQLLCANCNIIKRDENAEYYHKRKQGQES